MKLLFFDTETTGLTEKNADYRKLDTAPHIVQLSYLVYEIPDKPPYCQYLPIHVADALVKPVGYRIGEESAAIHGHTHEKATEFGRPSQT